MGVDRLCDPGEGLCESYWGVASLRRFADRLESILEERPRG